MRWLIGGLAGLVIVLWMGRYRTEEIPAYSPYDWVKRDLPWTTPEAVPLSRCGGYVPDCYQWDMEYPAGYAETIIDVSGRRNLCIYRNAGFKGDDTVEICTPEGETK